MRELPSSGYACHLLLRGRQRPVGAATCRPWILDHSKNQAAGCPPLHKSHLNPADDRDDRPYIPAITLDPMANGEYNNPTVKTITAQLKRGNGFMQETSCFELKLLDWLWVNDSKDYPEDLCLHGYIYFRLGENVITDSYYCTISAAGLYLLRSIEDDHTVACGHMFPCCGFFADWGIVDCPNGIWLLVSHVDDKIKLTTSDTNVVMPLAEYKEIILPFIEEIETIYEQNPRQLPEDKSEREVYAEFWDEWKSLKATHF